MERIKIIFEILKEDAVGAWHAQGKFIGHPEYYRLGDDWEYPYRKYVHHKFKIIGTTGGPSEATITEDKFTWNKGEINRASTEDLIKLRNATKKSNEYWSNLLLKYGHSMSLLDFLNCINTPE